MNPVKLTGYFSYEVVATIQRLACSRGVSGAEVIRQAVSSEQFVDRVLSEGGDILVLHRSGEIDRIMFY